MSELEAKPNDRLGFTAFVAVALHAAAILGIGFTWQIQQASSPTIEVTLSQFSDDTAPEDASFIAATNQLGSGDAAEILEKTTTSEADFVANVEQDVLPEPILVLPEDSEIEREAELTTNTSSDWEVNAEQDDPADAEDGFNTKTLEEPVSYTHLTLPTIYSV